LVPPIVGLDRFRLRPIDELWSAEKLQHKAIL
jgi:hypothetical protein